MSPCLSHASTCVPITFVNLTFGSFVALMEASRDFQDKTPLEEMTLKEYVIASKTLSSLCSLKSSTK